MVKKHFTIFGFAVVAIVGIIALGRCGGSSSSSGVSVSGLNQVPNSSTMVGTSGSSIARGLIKNYFPINLQTISGTPPDVDSLTTANVDTYFFNGVVATINGYSNGDWTALSTTAKQTLANQFWGSTTDGPAGNGGCFMAQGTAEAIARVIGAGNSGCYMKGMSAAASGVTITGSTLTQSQLFERAAADKLIKVQVQNMQEQGQTVNMDVFIKVFGTDSVGGSVYKARLHFCQNGTQKGYEVLTINEADGTMTSENYDSQNSGTEKFTGVVTAKLKAGGSGLVFDKAADREATFNFYKTSGGLQHYKGYVKINGSDQIYSKRYFNSTWGKNMNYSVASFTGSSFASLKFNEGAFKGYNLDSSNKAHSYTGAAVFRDTYYKNTTSDFSSLVSDYAFTSDTHFTDTTPPTVTLEDSCSPTVDATVAMNFADTAIAAVKTTCDAERFDNYNMCWGSALQAAQTRLMSMY